LHALEPKDFLKLTTDRRTKVAGSRLRLNIASRLNNFFILMEKRQILKAAVPAFCLGRIFKDKARRLRGWSDR
jgi:hypothetical protein